MRLIFHGALKNLVGDFFDMASNTVGDAIEGFSLQHPKWPRDMLVSVVGYDSPDKMQEYAEEVHIMPTLRGGGGKFINFIIGGAMIIAGVVLLSVPGGQAVGISLIVSGSLMVVQGVISLFMKAPTIGKNAANPDDSKYFGVNQNTTAVRTPMIMAWGRVNIFPHWLSLQADSSLMAHGAFPVTP